MDSQVGSDGRLNLAYSGLSPSYPDHGRTGLGRILTLAACYVPRPHMAVLKCDGMGDIRQGALWIPAEICFSPEGGQRGREARTFHDPEQPPC
jgi:hypothetical protein